MFSDSTIVIPCRQNSKGLELKNRNLFKYTALTIPPELNDRVVVSTDDPQIMEMAVARGYRVEVRPENLALDTTSVKSVLVDLRRKLPETTYCVTLYLTYPERTWQHVEQAMRFMLDKPHVKSLLCRKELTSAHPYLMMVDKPHNLGGQLVTHNLYRRQDYPKVFELSHYIQICKWDALAVLNENLYYKRTRFFPIPDVVDVDTPADFERFKDKSFAVEF